MKLNKIFKKFHENKGITGADIAVAIAVIVITMGVVTAIYVNLINKSKENLRYSAATRIATQIMENIQVACYDEVIYRGEQGIVALREIDKEEDGTIFGVRVPKGYSAKITLSNAQDIDVVREITVTVGYSISKTDKNITLYTLKQKELLEQTNKPDIALIKDYSLDPNVYYPIKKLDSGEYIITTRK